MSWQPRQFKREGIDLGGPKRVWRDAIFEELQVGDLIPTYGSILEILNEGARIVLKCGLPDAFQVWVGDADTKVYAFTGAAVDNS